MVQAMPTISPQKASRSLRYSSSSTSASAVRWPTLVFHHQPDPAHRPNRKREAAYHKTDAAIQTIADLLAALQLDLTDQNVEVFLFTIFDLRI